MKPTAAVLIVLASLVAPGVLAQPRVRPTINNKPVYDIEVMPVVETSLTRMWESADVVAEVLIESSVVKGIDVPDISGRPQLPQVRTFHTSRVLRVLAGDVAKGSRIVVMQIAGQLELADKVLRIEGFAPLAAGDRYVVFLRRLESRGVWTLVGDREGAFKLKDGRVQPQGRGVVALEQSNVTERDFQDELDRVARRAKPKA
jgi:hypothetical protein